MNISKAKILSLLDLTSLNDNATPAVIDALCSNATQSIGKVAAVCVYPPFVAQCRAMLPASCGINVATVVNFPTGDEPLADVLAQTQQALADGANEIDLVFPYKALQQGNAAAGEAMCSQIATLVHQHAGSLKVILETGALSPAEIAQAAQIAIAAGADFLKTSTGKIAHGASLEASAILLEQIAQAKQPVGLKISGGVRDIATAQAYIAQAAAKMGEGWVQPENFRIGASSLLKELISC